MGINIMEEQNERKCSWCKKSSPDVEFTDNKKLCTGCGEKSREKHRENREKERQQATEYYENNKEDIKVLRKQYREQNKGTIQEQGKHYRERKKEQIKQANKEYYDNNRDVILEKQRERFKVKVECPICKTEFVAHQKSRHEETIKHKKNLNKESEVEQ